MDGDGSFLTGLPDEDKKQKLAPLMGSKEGTRFIYDALAHHKHLCEEPKCRTCSRFAAAKEDFPQQDGKGQVRQLELRCLARKCGVSSATSASECTEPLAQSKSVVSYF